MPGLAGPEVPASRADRQSKSDIAAETGTQKVTRVTNDNIPDMDPVWAPVRSTYFASAGGGMNPARRGVAVEESPTAAREDHTGRATTSSDGCARGQQVVRGRGITRISGACR